MARILEPYEIVHSSDAVCRRWALMVATARAAGRPLPFADSWIAATALVQNIPLVTHNPGDFQGIPDPTLVSQAQSDW